MNIVMLPVLSFMFKITVPLKQQFLEIAFPKFGNVFMIVLKNNVQVSYAVGFLLYFC